MKRKLILLGALASMVWNFYLVANATANTQSILPRVAGGHFDSIPLILRIMFGIQTLLAVFQFYFLVQLFQRDGAWSKNSYLLVRVFLILAALSAVMNAVSRSPLERWNAIAAGLIALGYYVLGNVRFRPTN